MSNNKGKERKARAGYPFKPSAGTWNAIIDSVKSYRRNQGAVGAIEAVSNTLMPGSTILVKNLTGAVLSDSFSVVRMGDPILDITDVHAANNRPAFEGYHPLSADDSFAISQVPMGTNEFGKAIFAGITVAYVRMNDAGHQWCEPINGESGFLDSVACSGQARILAHAADDDLPEGVEVALINIIGAACQDAAPAVSLTNGYVENSSNTAITSNFVWTDVTGLSQSLDPGTYIISVTVYADVVTNDALRYIDLRIYDDTIGIQVGPGYRVALTGVDNQSIGSVYSDGRSGTIVCTYEIGGTPSTIKLQAERGGGTFSTSSILAFGRLSWIKIA